MKLSILLQPLAVSTLLFAAACGGTNQSADAGNGLTNEGFAELDNESLGDDELPGDVELVDLPEPPAGVPAAETAPLAQAAALAEEIDEGTDVERVPYEGGWAWRRDGWFRPGETAPFLVQRGEETFAYRAGRPERAFDRRGRPGAVSAQRQEEARRLAEESRRDRERAERAPRRPETDRERQGRDRTGRDENRSGTSRTEREGQGNRLRPDDRGGDRDRRRDDRRQRGDDSSGNRQ